MPTEDKVGTYTNMHTTHTHVDTLNELIHSSNQLCMHYSCMQKYFLCIFAYTE